MPTNPDILATAKQDAGVAAFKRVAQTWYYLGFEVGSRISDDEYAQAVTAVITDVDAVAAQGVGSNPAVLQKAKMSAAIAALKRVVGTWTYDGMNVGSRVSDDWYAQACMAIVTDVDAVIAQAA